MGFPLYTPIPDCKAPALCFETSLIARNGYASIYEKGQGNAPPFFPSGVPKRYSYGSAAS